MSEVEKNLDAALNGASIEANADLQDNGQVEQTETTYINKNEYEVDTSDEEDLRNTIGNVPLKWYDDYDHIGYDLDGKKISKPAGDGETDQLDEFLNKMEDPDYWRTVKDRQTGGKIVLSQEDIDVIKRLTGGRYANDNVNEFETAPFFTQDEMQMALSGRPEHKRSFVPSKWERLQVGKYVHAIKMGWIKPRLHKRQTEVGEKEPEFYDIWGQDNDDANRKHMQHLPAPKCPLPEHNESYNPPPEYLLDEEELAKWEKSEKEDRRINFIPKKYASLRVVPGYGDLIKERFERCLDMYLAPRQRKMRVHVDPQSLIPQLPKPKDLQPFPNTLSIIFKGHKSAIHSLSVHHRGQWLLSAANDKSVRVWEVATGRCMNTWKFDEKCVYVNWLPSATMTLFSVAFGKTVLIINPKLGDKVISSNTDSTLNEYRLNHEQTVKDNKTVEDPANPVICQWHFYKEKSNDPLHSIGYRIKLTHQHIVKNFSWHPKSDYFTTVLDLKNSNNSVIMHQLSRQKSVRPFAKMTGAVQQVCFHPYKPVLFVATQRYVKVYD